LNHPSARVGAIQPAPENPSHTAIGVDMVEAFLLKMDEEEGRRMK
jgi:hypothetical protein